MKSAQSFGFVDERLLLGGGQLSPSFAESLADLGVVDVRSMLEDLAALDLLAEQKIPYSDVMRDVMILRGRLTRSVIRSRSRAVHG